MQPMTAELQTEGDDQATVQNIGGVSESSAAFSPDVPILTGRNATNRTSFLQALMVALGSKQATWESDEGEGQVQLDLGGETYSRTLERQGEAIITGGDSFLGDATLADLRAFLLESYEAKRGVAMFVDLWSNILEPVDTDKISDEIDWLIGRQEELEAEFEEIDQLAEKLPVFEKERTSPEADIDEKEAEVADLGAEIEVADADIEDRRETESEVEETLSDLHHKSSELDDVRYDLETEEESLEQLHAERRELEEELDELNDAPTVEFEEVEAKLDDLRSSKRDLESAVSELHNIIGFNEERVEEGTGGAMPQDDDDENVAVTDQLLEGNQVKCWTWGSTVERDRIESTIDRLREQVQDRRAQVSELEGEINGLRERG